MRRRNLPEARHCESGALAMAGIFEKLEAEWHEHHHHHDAPQPAAAPASPHNETQEVTPMSLYTELAADARALAAKADSADHAMLDMLDAVLANPGTADAFTILGDLAHISPPLLATGVDVLRMIRQNAASQQQSDAQAVPMGPVTGGVA